MAGVEVVTLMVMQQMENGPGGCLNVTVELAMVMILSVKLLVVAIGELLPRRLQSNLWSFGYLDVLFLKTTSEESHIKFLASIFSSSSHFLFSLHIKLGDFLTLGDFHPRKQNKFHLF
ncbi:hypothetical protein Hdeb2414_s0005g00160571 [Helianthus debilis subsp. tardiflorus]